MMDLRAILFDVNGTLIDIETDEGQDGIYRAISQFLTYQGVALEADEVRDQYFRIMDEQRRSSRERYPEFDAVAIWRALLEEAEAGALKRLPHEKLRQLPLVLAELHRALARRRLTLYPDVRAVLDELGQRYALGVITDAQSAYARPELAAVGLDGVFTPVIISGDYGYRKPDPRLFAAALDALGVRPDQAIYVGNDMYCDIFGAQQAGLRAVFWPTQYGKKAHDGVEADYIIYSFAQLPEAVAFLAGRQRTPDGGSPCRA
jgi:putative hydrolase of the HAD superfamily